MFIDINMLESKLQDLKEKYSRASGELALLKRQKEAKQKELVEIQNDIKKYQLIQILYTEASEFTRQQIKTRIDDTVTAALQTVLEDNEIRFNTEMKQYTGQPAAYWQVIDKYGEFEVCNSPEDSRGGGIVDMVSIALNLIVLELIEPPLAGPFFADEPAKMVSREYLPNLSAFLKSYSKEKQRQIIMITHAMVHEKHADKLIKVGKKNGESEVEEL
jgi:hypothetical protein